MEQHRIRLGEKDLELLRAALRSRRAATSGTRRWHLDRLLIRLEENVRGNPRWIFDNTRELN